MSLPLQERIQDCVSSGRMRSDGRLPLLINWRRAWRSRLGTGRSWRAEGGMAVCLLMVQCAGWVHHLRRRHDGKVATCTLCSTHTRHFSQKPRPTVPFWNSLYQTPVQRDTSGNHPSPRHDHPMRHFLANRYMTSAGMHRAKSLLKTARSRPADSLANHSIHRRQSMLYAPPGSPNAKVTYKPRYDNFIGGQFVAPVKGGYFDVLPPITGKPYTQAARSTAEDIELALDAAHAASAQWGRTPAAERANILLKIADRIEQNLEMLAYAETVDNGKAIRETLNADIPLTVDHFRYFAGCLRSQEGSLSEIDADTIAYHFHEPLGVVGQIIPWNFPILMAAWKLAPALAAGNCVVLKPAEQTPMSILVLAELIADILPAGTLNIVNGFGIEAGKPLATNNRISKIAFTGETTTGRLIMQYASEKLIPSTLELGGKNPNIFFADVMDHDDDFLDKALEGFTMFALNQGEVCTCPSRALVHESIYDRFMEKAIARVEAIKLGSPLDASTMIGAQASNDQMEKILSYIQIGKDEGAKVLTDLDVGEDLL